MKKGFILSLALVVVISSVFASCTSKNAEDDNSTTTKASTTEPDLQNVETEFGFETDENGETVAVVYETNKKGETVAVKLDSNGEKVTDKNGEKVTIKTTNVITPTTTTTTTTTSNKNNDKDTTTDKGGNKNPTEKLTTTTAPSPTGTTKKNVPLTESKETTKFDGSETVPLTTDNGKKINFSIEDQEIVTSMLEVPYLYLSSYENSDGVPIDIACHVAVWMAEREGGTSNVYPSSPVVLNLFKYFGQTVVNFKTQCNDFAASGNAPIEYDKTKDQFNIREFTPKKQTVKITEIEDLGNNNFYKITGKVSDCEKKKVVAIVQKNRLDRKLGFSIKALSWS